MQEAATRIEREAPTYKGLDGRFSFTVSGRHVNDKTSALTVHDVLQGLKNKLMMLRDNKGLVVLSLKHCSRIFLEGRQQL